MQFIKTYRISYEIKNNPINVYTKKYKYMLKETGVFFGNLEFS